MSHRARKRSRAVDGDRAAASHPQAILLRPPAVERNGRSLRRAVPDSSVRFRAGSRPRRHPSERGPLPGVIPRTGRSHGAPAAAPGVHGPDGSHVRWWRPRLSPRRDPGRTPGPRHRARRRPPRPRRPATGPRPSSAPAPSPGKSRPGRPPRGPTGCQEVPDATGRRRELDSSPAPGGGRSSGHG